MADQRRATADFVVIANRLPVRRHGDRWETSPGGLVAALAPVLAKRSGAWVGWSGDETEGDDVLPEPFVHDDMLLQELPMSRAAVADHYEGAANGTIWPLYHDAIQAPEFHRHWWRTHVAVNERFAEATARIAARDAVVWVHDYQLQFVPRMLRELRPDLRIGFFLHIPFPPEELFVRLPWRREVIEGLLGADLVGFQTLSDVRNFRSLARRLAGHPVRHGDVTVGNRIVRTGAFPITVDVTSIEEAARRPGRDEAVTDLRHRLGDPVTVLLGVDRLDYTKGIEVRLKAFQELLEDGVLAVPKAVMVQVATPSREDVAAYVDERDRIERLVGEINGMYGRVGAPAVHYIHRNLPFDDLVTLYRAADVMMVTPFRDGMNLVAKEFVAAKVDGSGALVLSEFAGAAHELTAATLVNPHDTDGVREAMSRLLETTPTERRVGMRTLRRTVRRADVHDWANGFLAALEAATNER
ncbi:MAG: trehalose-6-phosphate synthase [Actinomycetota bacterium]